MNSDRKWHYFCSLSCYGLHISHDWLLATQCLSNETHGLMSFKWQYNWMFLDVCTNIFHHAVLLPAELCHMYFWYWVAVPQQDSRYNTHLHRFQQHWGQNHLHTYSLQPRGYLYNIHHHSLHFALSRHLQLKMKVAQSTRETNTKCWGLSHFT